MKRALIVRERSGIVGVYGVNASSWKIDEDGFIRDRPNKQSAWNLRRTVYKPMMKLSEDLVDSYSEVVFSVAEYMKIPPATLIATAANESAGNENSLRVEPHISDYSFGLCQQVTGTAFTVGRLYGWNRADRILKEEEPYIEWIMPMMSIPSGVNRLTPAERVHLRVHWQRFLSNPWVSFFFAAFVFDAQAKRWKTEHDPILDYATYNSGGLYEGKTRYGLHATRSALEAFTLFYNDAVAIL